MRAAKGLGDRSATLEEHPAGPEVGGKWRDMEGKAHSQWSRAQRAEAIVWRLVRKRGIFREITQVLGVAFLEGHGCQAPLPISQDKICPELLPEPLPRSGHR